MELPELVKKEPSTGTAWDISQPVWTNSITEAIVEKAELVIGGQTIQELTGEMSVIKSELETPEFQYDALQKITNRYMKGGGTVVYDKFINQISGGTVFMQMRFYFHKHPSLAIPLLSLDKQEVEIHLTLRPFFSLINAYSTDPANDNFVTNSTSFGRPRSNWSYCVYTVCRVYFFGRYGKGTIREW